MGRSIVLYAPVLHAGYIKFLEKYRDGTDAVFVLGDDIIAEFHPLKKEIRALDPAVAKTLIESLKMFPRVTILEKNNVGELVGKEIVAATDEMSRKIIEKYLPKNSVEYAPVFLRWDEKNVKSSTETKYDRASEDPFDRKMCDLAAQEGDKSSDWWRHVGAVLVKDGKALSQAHNNHVPSEQMPYIQGDPRDVVEAGTLNLVYTSLHAEQTLVAEAAKQGVSLEGTSMYLNVFPCPLCAKLIAYSGIKKCFFRTGSAWLDAESVLRANGVEIVFVK